MKAQQAQIYNIKMSWPSTVETWLRTKVKGSCLHLCSGRSSIGFSVDLRREANPKLIADIRHIPLQRKTFDTVICDPPYGFYNRFAWILPLKDLARERFILSAPPIDISRMVKGKLTVYLIFSGTFFLRHFWIWDLTSLERYL